MSIILCGGNNAGNVGAVINVIFGILRSYLIRDNIARFWGNSAGKFRVGYINSGINDRHHDIRGSFGDVPCRGTVNHRVKVLLRIMRIGRYGIGRILCYVLCMINNIVGDGRHCI